MSIWNPRESLPALYEYHLLTYEVRYGDLGRSQLQQLQQVHAYFWQLRNELSSRQIRQVANALLSSTRFGTKLWKVEAIESLHKIIKTENDLSMNVRIEVRKAILRENAKISFQVQVPDCDLSLRTEEVNAQIGSWHVLEATSLMEDNKLQDSLRRLRLFEPLNPIKPSTLEQLVLEQKSVAYGRVLRYQGNFIESLFWFKKASTVKVSRYIRTTCSIICHLATAYCELGNPAEAEKITKDELNALEQCEWPNMSHIRRVKLSLAVAYLHQDLLENAKDLYESLQATYEATPCPDRAAQIMNFNVRMGMAQIAHRQGKWSEARVMWERAWCSCQSFGWENGFLEMIVTLSLSDVDSHLGEHENASALQAKGISIFKRKGRQYFFVGLGTSWLNYLSHSMGIDLDGV
jgi:tetratricopeptide (TPR) repeat protein